MLSDELARLTHDQVATINEALTLIRENGGFGRVELVVEKDRIALIGTGFTEKYKAENGPGDTPASTG